MQKNSNLGTVAGDLPGPFGFLRGSGTGRHDEGKAMEEG